MATKKRPQDGLHEVLKNIRYHGEGEHHRKLIRPEDGVKVTFSHLNDVDYAVVIRRGLAKPVGDK